jgi:lipopolysaccharide export system permease protein
MVVAGGMVWFNNTVLPEANHHLAQLRSSIARKTPTLALRERSVNEVIPKKLFLRAARIDPATSRLEDVTIWDARDPDLTRTIWADSGRMGLNAAQTALYLTLRDGKLLERDAENRTEIQEVWFDTDYLRVPGIGNELERQDSRIRGDRELPIDSMQARARTSDSAAAYGATVSREAAVAWTVRLLGGLAPDTLPPDSSVAALEGWRNGRSVVTPAGAENAFRTQALIVEHHREDENAYRVEIQKKISIPAACVVFVLIGAPVATRYRRAGVALVVGMSLAVFCLYYVALIGGEHLADKRLLSPAWAMWAPNVLFGAIGIGAFLHSRRAGG